MTDGKKISIPKTNSIYLAILVELRLATATNTDRRRAIANTMLA